MKLKDVFAVLCAVTCLVSFAACGKAGTKTVNVDAVKID
mgnify:CR=1 FL=1